MACYPNSPATNVGKDEETKCQRRLRTRAGQVLPSALECRHRNGLELGDIGVIALPHLGESAPGQTPGVL